MDESAAGFTNLFDGRTLAGWRMAGEGRFVVADGTLETEGGMGLLWYTRRQFRDFILRVDWRVTQPADNSGVFVRFPDPGDDAWVAVNQGYEIQIGDQADPLHQTGAIYGFKAPQTLASKPVGEWNTFEIAVVGQQYTVTLNGTPVTEFTGDRHLEGFVGLQNHDPGSRVAFRTIRIRALP